MRFCNRKECEFSKRDITAKEKLIKEELSKVRNLIFQKKILEGKNLLVNVIQESKSLSESFSSFIFSQASEILDYCEDFIHNKKKLMNIEDIIKEKKYSIAEARLKDLIDEIENYVGDKEILNREVLNKALILLDKLPNLLEEDVNKLNIRNFIQNLSNVNEFPKFMAQRVKLFGEMISFYNKYKNYENANEKMTNLFIQFYSPYFKINPFEVGIQNFVQSFKILKDNEINRLNAIIKDNEDLENLHYKLTKIDYGSFIDEKLRLISKEVKELKYDVPVENMYNFLLDFSEIIPMSTKTEDSTDNEYTLNSGWGPLHFKILEKEPNKKITYMYDFLSSYGEKGTFYIELIEPSSGKVIVKTRNNIQEISKKAREALQIYNFFNQYLKYYLDSSIGKIVAKVVQTTFYEKTFDDLTMGNYRILQAKFNALGKDINKLKARFFEVKSPLTLNSFECSECGATLNITSKEEKFIICDHCSTPFLMEWQKGL
ncbi:hypothetical protein ES705_13566 [subsurface metagenome]